MSDRGHSGCRALRESRAMHVTYHGCRFEKVLAHCIHYKMLSVSAQAPTPVTNFQPGCTFLSHFCKVFA
jgi:hypothetical protein